MSTGGLLALLLAAHEDVAGVVGLAAAYRVSATPAQLRQTHFLRLLGIATAKGDKASDPINQRIETIQRERGEQVTGRVAYYQQTAAGIAELVKLQNETGRQLGRIKAPVLLIDSREDKTVPLAAADLLQKGLTSSRDVQRLTLEKSSHIVTNDVESEDAFVASWAFIERHSQPARRE
jgi:carboxylesterase